MDIRDIKQEPDEILDGQYLESIYELQKVLIDHYVGIEGLPPYPVDVNTKKSQVLLKDFTGRVTEELAEGFESHLLIGQLTHEHQYWMGEDGNSKPYSQMINHLQNMNEEQADAMHFMAELLIFCNIQPEDIQSWIDNQVETLKLNQPQYNVTNHPYMDPSGDIIANAMMFIRAKYEESFDFRKGCDLVSFITEDKKKYVPGGRHMSLGLMESSEKLLWTVTYHLNIARNCLKNKPWKQSGVMTDETLYQSKVVEAFVNMMGYFSLIGLESKDVYYLYFKKNLVNQFRIKSNY